MKNALSAAYAAVMICLLSCVGCHSTHFGRKDFNVKAPDGSTYEAANQCSKNRNEDESCFEYVDIDQKGYGTLGIGASPALYTSGMIPPTSMQYVHVEPMVLFPEGERAMEGVSGGSVHYQPVAVIPPAGNYATKEQVAAVARKVKQLDDEAKKKSEDKSEEKASNSKKEGK